MSFARTEYTTIAGGFGTMNANILDHELKHHAAYVGRSAAVTTDK